MTTKNKRVAQQQAQRPAAQGMITPPEIVAGLTVIRTIGDNEEFGRCSHALQLLPNGVLLLLVTSISEEGGTVVASYLLGEEIPGFKITKAMIEAPDAPS